MVRKQSATDLFDAKQLGKKQSFKIVVDGIHLVFSYRTLVAVFDYNTANHLVTQKQHSKTTTSHTNDWLEKQHLDRSLDSVKEVSQEYLEKEAYSRLGETFSSITQ